MSIKKLILQIMAWSRLGFLFHKFFPILLNRREKIGKFCIYGGSFNPPTCAHTAIAKILTRFFDEVIIVPCGERPDKKYPETKIRQKLILKSFGGIPRVMVDTRIMTQKNLDPLELAKFYIQEKGTKDVWVALGADVVNKHQKGEDWTEYDNFNFVILERDGYHIQGRLPKNCKVLYPVFGRVVCSTKVRTLAGELQNPYTRPSRSREIQSLLPENCTLQDILYM